MRTGIVALVLAYVLSQFYRAFLAVLTPALKTDLGLTPSDIAFAAGVWFITFAVMQIPVGSALDRFGPRLTAAVLFAIGGAGGALVFALAQTSMQIYVAMALIGVGCSPVLMASYFIFARIYPAAVFATLAGATIGFGSLGNIFSSAPLAWAVASFGWRGTMIALATLTLAVAALLSLTVKDPERVVSTQKGSVLTLLANPALWPVFLMMLVSYAPAAGVRGSWAGGYLSDVFGADARTIGSVTLIMGLAMIAGNFAYGPLDRWLGTRKWVIFAGNVIALGALIGLIVMPDRGIWTAALLFAVLGAAGASFPMIVAHAKAFFPSHLTGRGMTLINLFGIGGAGIMQFATRPVFAAADMGPANPAHGYAIVFAFFAITLAIGLAAYLFAQDRTD
jgi:nitrate/nitrite transporter NarK